ncbi:MAG: flagellar hook-associated protein FlgL [Synergistaceae bacterium]|jgi:flagellin-like hook-associated protein FlgL|nr:flagellar hook-associated protein FlgL [Synergistaceae bacterium]
MTYRVTNSMMQSLMLNDMHTNLNKLLDIQQQLSTQRKYQYASQNPHAVTKGMNIETMMTETEQYISNLQDAVSWLKFTDDALGDMNDMFVRVRELAVNGGDGGLEDVDRAAIGEELRQLKEAFISVANSTIGGEYLFSGLKTGTIPFAVGESGDVVYNGNNYALFWEFARQQTGKVSLTGREVFPIDETTNRLKGIEVPMDFQWSGRSEILEFKVGWKTVKVRIPEDWTDEIANGLTDTSDYNRFRDPGEPLEGLSLDDIANIINSSEEMGDVSQLLKATVVKDYDRGVQYLQIQSLTGEPVRLTSWPETDPINAAQGIKGAAYGSAGRAASAAGQVSVRFGDNSLYTVDVAKGETLQDIASKLNSLPDGRVWAAYKTDGTNEWIDIAGRNPDDYYSLTTTGGAAALFATEMTTALSKKTGNEQIVSSNVFDAAFSTIADGTLTIRQGVDTYDIPITVGSGIAAVVAAVMSAGIPGMTASENPIGALEITSSGEQFSVTASGGLVPLYSDGVYGASNAQVNSDGKFALETKPLPLDFELDISAGTTNALEFEYDGVKYWMDLIGGISGLPSPASLNDVAAYLETELNNVMSGLGLTADFTVTVETGLDENGAGSQWMRIETSNGAFKLSGFGGAADILSSFIVGSMPIADNADHTHIGFAAMMQMETSLTSTEISVADTGWDATAAGNAVHLNFVSGNKHAEVFIADDAGLTLESLAARINSVCGDWLQAVVETDAPDGVSPIIDPLDNSGDNSEGATRRLVLRTIDGEPFAVYDGQGKNGVGAGSYADLLGVNTALTIENILLWDTAANSPVPGGYPSDGAGFFDENMPAILKVTVGDREYEVKVCKNNRYTGELVAKAIVDQVNEQYGGALLAVGENTPPTAAGASTFSVYALSGEPLRVVDAAYGDPRFQEYTGGIASQLGISAGLTTSGAMTDTTTFGPGVIRISAPGHTVDVPVLAGEDLYIIANRIRDYAGSWLDVSFYDSNIKPAGGTVSMSLAAKDGSAVSVYDVNGDAAWNMGLDTGLVGAADLSGFNFGTLSDDATLSITVNGATHTIDLTDNSASPPTPAVNNAEELAALINTRFQAQDIRAEVLVTKDASGNVTMKRLAIWSPKGYTFEIDGTGTDGTDNIPDAFGFAAALGNASSKNHGGSGPFNQVVTHRTGNNQYDIDFFGVLDNLINTVEGGNVDGISDTMISQLDKWLSTLLKCRAQDGALTNRYDTAVYRMTSNNTNYTDLYTQTVGVDLAEAITNFQMASGIYEAGLAAIARLLQPSLLDFLR